MIVSAKPGPYGKAVAQISAELRSGPMSTSALIAGSRFFRSRHQVVPASLTRPVAVSLNVPSFVSAVVSVRPLLDQHVQRGRNLLERVVDHVALPGERAGHPIQLLDRRDDVVPLGVQHADEIVQPGEQFADLGFASGQRGIEVVDDVAELPQPATVDDGRQRRQRLLGGRIGRRLAQRDGGTGLQSAARLFARAAD